MRVYYTGNQSELLSVVVSIFHARGGSRAVDWDSFSFLISYILIVQAW